MNRSPLAGFQPLGDNKSRQNATWPPVPRKRPRKICLSTVQKRSSFGCSINHLQQLPLRLVKFPLWPLTFDLWPPLSSPPPPCAPENKVPKRAKRCQKGPHGLQQPATCIPVARAHARNSTTKTPKRDRTRHCLCSYRRESA